MTDTDHTMDAWVVDQRAEDRLLGLEHKLNTLSKNVSVLIARLTQVEETSERRPGVETLPDAGSGR
jgi:hypothetical protein